MKKSLLLISAVLCGNLFAQERRIVVHSLREPVEHVAPADDVLILAQQASDQGAGFFPGVPPQGPAPAPGRTAGSAAFGGSGQGSGGHTTSRLAGVVRRVSEPGMFGGPFEEGTKRTLLVGFSKLDPAARQGIQEDVQIMSRILDKAAERAFENTQDRRMGIVVTTIPGTRGENIYIEDYGPLFVLNVPIPLVGGGKGDAEKKEKLDSDWEQTKRELYQNQPGSGFEPMKYDAQKVEALKKALLEALKNATNIRQLKPDQNITLVVTGGENMRQSFSKTIVSRQPGEPQKEEGRSEIFETKVAGPQQTTLTIRVKKSDVDAFAKGKMNLDEFTNKAVVSSN
ncbi:MAG: hypothetical protein JWM68_5038 [Verrucomicrobiales bacterium]|nr:hypothetical protein [Verrucomicrobiales bacterium]